MCGIAGIINLSGNIQNIPVHIKTMTDTLRHRGPDDEGFLFFNSSEIIPAFGKDTPQSVIHSLYNYSPKVSVKNIQDESIRFALGHRRLSILDISSAGHQPMCDAEKKIWIVFNGEIYNYIELREELQKKNFSFSTHSDTEVLINSYLSWGEDCVNHFNGVWAFVIFDSRKNGLFASRDRVGVKPFYYYKDESVFAFASEQKALLKLPFVKSGINLQAASRFLAGGIEHVEQGEESMFKNIYELMPAHNFSFDLGTNSFSIRKYYLFKANTFFSGFNKKEFKKHKDTTEQLLVNAVKLRLRSDVPVGSCLSGGIDSSSIVGIMKNLIHQGHRINLNGKLNVFTLKFNEPEIDESKWAKYMIEPGLMEWNLVSPTEEELFNDFVSLNYAQDIPICSSGAYAQFRLMRQAKERGIKVTLDGQGGDELFGGYPSHSIVFWNELLHRGKLTQLFSEMTYNKNPFPNFKHFLNDLAKRQFASLLPRGFQKSFYKIYFKQNYFLQDSIVNEYIHSGAIQSEVEVGKSVTLNEALLKNFTNTLLKMYLKYEDRSSMWHSIEARTPFADDFHLVEYVFSIPGTYKIHNGVNKYLLRESMKDYLPQEIKQRKDKLGLVTPIEKWVKQMQHWSMDYFTGDANDFIDEKKIKNYPDKFFNITSHADSIRVLRIISFAVWKRIFNL